MRDGALMPSAYDELPYERFPIEALHVDHLATVARLFGLSPAPAEGSSVLELGCGSGANLIPMAAALAGGRFVGVDLSRVQIERARAQVERLGLRNITFEVADISDLTSALGRFDQVIAHGVYSWVPEGVRDALMRVASECLASGGVACISYSVLPGAHLRLALGDMLRWRDDRTRAPADRAGDASFFAAMLSRELSDTAPMTAALRRLVGELGGMSDAYVLHDFLAEHNTPVTLSTFASHARRWGLQYVADANVHTMYPASVDDASRRGLAALAADDVELEQLVDFATQRSFRSSLLCHGGQTVDRSLAPAALEGLSITTRARARGLEDGHWWFRAPGRLPFGVRSGAVAAVMDRLQARAPRPVPVAELAVEALGEELMALFLADHVELCTGDRGIGDGRGFSVARDQVLAGELSVTNLWHRTVALDRDQLALLPLLDGTRTREQLLVDLGDHRHDLDWLDLQLEGLGACALLAAEA